MPSDDLDPILLARYFSGEGSETDVQSVRRWIAADPARSFEVDRLREIWRIGGEIPSEWDVEGALAAVRARGESPANVLSLTGRVARTPSLELLRPAPTGWRVVTRRIAAGVAIAVGLGLGWRATISAVPDAASDGAMRTFTTANAEQATITLADGTRVVLGPASTLRVPKRFGSRSRHVSLGGEAYFSVARDTLRPFTVASGIGLVQVLGTKFDVRARPEEGGMTVVVAEGRVSLRSIDTAGSRAGTPMILTAGDLGRLTPDGTPQLAHGVEVEHYVGWTDSRLTFVDTPLPLVLAELTRWYDVDFRLGDPALAQRHLSTSVRRETISQILDVLKTSLDVRWSRTGRTITLYRLRP